MTILKLSYIFSKLKTPLRNLILCKVSPLDLGKKLTPKIKQKLKIVTNERNLILDDSTFKGLIIISKVFGVMAMLTK
jgi:hypothetical protein